MRYSRPTQRQLSSLLFRATVSAFRPVVPATCLRQCTVCIICSTFGKLIDLLLTDNWSLCGCNADSVRVFFTARQASTGTTRRPITIPISTSGFGISSPSPPKKEKNRLRSRRMLVLELYIMLRSIGIVNLFTRSGNW